MLIIKTLRLYFLLILLATLLYAKPCETKKFDIAISKNISFYEILEQLAKECHLSIIYRDKASQSILEDKNILLNFYHASLKEILQTGFEALDLDYIFESQKIYISHLKTKNKNFLYQLYCDFQSCLKQYQYHLLSRCPTR